MEAINTTNTANNGARQILYDLRGGDYAHAGDIEAINLVLKRIEVSESILDIGCGFGGTLNYFVEHGFQHGVGIDMDKNAIEYACHKYPKLQFHHGDMLEVDKIFPTNSFNLIYSFNSIYAFEDKKTLLEKLNKIAKPDATLVLFDYSSVDKQMATKDLAGKEIYPIQPNTILMDLKNSGWDVVETMDLTKQYITWYQELLDKLAARKTNLSIKYSKDDIAKVERTFEYFLSQLQTQQMGGIVILATKRKQ